MKKYIKPETFIRTMNINAVLTTTSMTLMNEEIDGSEALGKFGNIWCVDED